MINVCVCVCVCVCVRSILSPSISCMMTGSLSKPPLLFLLLFWWVTVHVHVFPLFHEHVTHKPCIPAVLGNHTADSYCVELWLSVRPHLSFVRVFVTFESVVSVSAAGFSLWCVSNGALIFAGDSCWLWSSEDASSVWRTPWQNPSS